MASPLPSHDINFYQALHRKTRQRLEQERTVHREQLHRLRQAHRRQIEARCQAVAERLQADYTAKLKKLKEEFDAKEQAYQAKIIELQQQLSLYTDKVKGLHPHDRLDTSEQGDRAQGNGRKGGKRPGTSGGRQTHDNLPLEETQVTLDADERRCPKCGLPAVPSGLERVSTQVEYEIRAVRKRTRRIVYRRSCQCPQAPALFQAPLPPRAFPGSLYSDNFWIEVLLSKYADQIPTQVFLRQLAEHDLTGVKPATICGGIQRAAHLLQPLYQAIIAKSREAGQWGCDETSLAVFIAREGRETFNYFLWQYQCRLTVVFVLCPTRGGEHPQEYLRDCQGFLNVDRAKACKTLPSVIVLAFCWAHVRRDFIRLGRYQPGHRTWALTYLRIIRCLYRQNRQRLAADSPAEFAQKDAWLRSTMAALQETYQAELADDRLPLARRKVLASLENHWQGLNVFVDHPEIPMDNNETERNFRDVARFRRNCFGVFSERFGQITALLLTIFATLRKNGIALRAYLAHYFQAVAANHGQAPSNLTALLPWNLPANVRLRLQGQPEELPAACPSPSVGRPASVPAASTWEPFDTS
jgi:transposase